MKIKLDKVFTILAFIVSVGTLYLFFNQTSLMKKQQYASVLPYLEISNTHIDGDYIFIISNNGIGPAFIDEINIHYKDSMYKNSDVNDFFTNVIVKEDTLLANSNTTHATIKKGMLIPYGDTKEMVRLSKDAVNFDQKHYRLRDWFNNKIKIEIKYSSVYGEQWQFIYPVDDSPKKIN